MASNNQYQAAMEAYMANENGGIPYSSAPSEGTGVGTTTFGGRQSPICSPCPLCGTILRRKGDFTRHMGIHAPRKVFFCGYNGCQWYKSFHRKDKLVDHVTSRHKETRENAKEIVSKWPAIELDDLNDLAIDVAATGVGSQPSHGNALGPNYPHGVGSYTTNTVPPGWGGMNDFQGYGQTVAATNNTGYYTPQGFHNGPHLVPQADASAANWQAHYNPVFGNQEYFQSGEASTAQPEHYTPMDNNALGDESMHFDDTLDPNLYWAMEALPLGGWEQ